MQPAKLHFTSHAEGRGMTVYFQHVGEAGGARDFPRTIGTTSTGLVHFKWSDVQEYLLHLSAAERRELEISLGEVAPDGFQIWGIPSGAKSILRSLSTGDFLLLLEATTPGGQFFYAGRILPSPSIECPELSMHLWAAHKFPLIVFMLGGLTTYRYLEFCEAFGYSPKWNPAGKTYRLQTERIAASPFGDEERLVSSLIGFVPSLSPNRPVVDSTLLDLIELEISDEEGRMRLRKHLVRERSSKLIAAFKQGLKHPTCCVCGFDFEHMYGWLGRGFIEAHHVLPVSLMEEGHSTSTDDLVPVCSNCHRMLHRQFPTLDWHQLRDIIGEKFQQIQSK